VKTGTKIFLLIIAVCLVMCFYNLAKPKSGEPEKVIAPLDYSKPVYTTDHAIVCPLSLLSDRRADHDISAVMDMYTSAFTAESKAEKLGCEVWKSGIEVTAKPMEGMDPLVTVNTLAFTVSAHLTNDPEGKMRSADSNPAQSSAPLSSTVGHAVVTTPSPYPIPKGDVWTPSEEFGAEICLDSNAYADYDDNFIASMTNSGVLKGGRALTKEEVLSQRNDIIAKEKELAKQYRCTYIPPGTLLVSEGGDQIGAMAVVTAHMPDGTTIRGVTLPTMITQHQQQPTATEQQVQIQGSSPPTDRTPSPEETTPLPVDAVVAWTDPATGLMWTKKDNGVDVTWQEATTYCQNLQIVSQSDWRLPTIDELKGIFDSSINAPDRSTGGQAVPWQVKGSLSLSAWGEWSSSQGNAPGQAWVFGFGSGKPFSYRFDGLKKPRALCVRGSRE
jgi:hypothetical protein